MAADLILHGGVIHTVAGPHAAPGAPRPTSVAVAGGRICAVGTDVAEHRGRRTRVLDLAGRLVLPGFQDAHVHPPMGGLERTQCDLTGATTLAASVAAVAAYAAATDAAWILGGGWSMEAFPGGCPTADLLDGIAALRGRPVFLPNRDHHSAWVNSAALALAGITAGTPDPADGRIERLPDGSPAGALHEGAADLVERLVPVPDAAQRRHALLAAQDFLHSLGITGWQDAWVTPETLDSYRDLAASGQLTARVVGCQWWERTAGVEQIEAIRERRSRGLAGRFRPSSVKIMLDGVCETFTASMLAPYLDAHGHPSGNTGLRFVEPGDLATYVTALDAAQFPVHMHALGDRGVRDALDAIEAARRANGPSGNRHQIAHLQVVDPADVPRFGALDATANAQALWACADPQMVELTLPFLGAERGARQYPFASIARAGGRLALGSDWPVSSPNPLEILHVAVHRTDPDAPTGTPPFLPGERLGLDRAVYAYTMGSAYANHADDVTGSIEVGKYADLVVLDRDIFAPDAGPLAQARVDHTFVEGAEVYARNA